MNQQSDLMQFKDLFLSTAREYVQSLNTCVLALEKQPDAADLIEEIFRSAHSLKGQSAAMNFGGLGYLCHTIEDIFFEVKEHRLSLTAQIADVLFTAFDQISQSLDSIETTNQERDVSAITEQLKQLTGVATEGMGKSSRPSNSDTSTAPNETTIAQPPPESTQPQPSVVAATSADQTIPTIHTAQINVKAKSLDDMLALVEELLISEGKIKHLGLVSSQTDITNQAIHSEQLLDTLHYQVMKARAMPLSLVFDQLPRTVRDAARREEKQVGLEITGGDLELDRSIIDKLTEPLVHLLRNAVSHGIEHEGKIQLTATKQEDWVEISIRDNGVGIDWQKLAEQAGQTVPDDSLAAQTALLFSGTSTSTQVSQVSGRGVGLLAVKHMVEQSSGTISFSSQPGEGTTFTLRFPLSLAVVNVLHVSIDRNQYLIPSSLVAQIVSALPQHIITAADQPAIIWQDQEVPLIRLGQPDFALKDIPQTTALTIIIIRQDTASVGLLVDTASDVLDTVVKPVPPSLSDVGLYAGCSVLPNGQTALVLNPKGLV